MTSVREKLKYGFLSAVIAFVLLAQLGSGFRGTEYFAPFLSYPMYSKAHFEGERLDVSHRVYAVLANGQRRYIAPSDLGLDFWRYERRFVTPLVKDRRQETAPFIDLALKRYPNTVRLEVDNYPMIITRRGPVSAPAETIARQDILRRVGP